jgi:bifunctional non-homologous end joining protein LigD
MSPLEKYNKKRIFSATPEPGGNAKLKRHNKLIFVVQKHSASHLHFDLRLELGGVLKSWAVPKGPSMNPHDRHLAIAVEDHPYEYKNFHGRIPKGNYGAGTVEIYDTGTYEPRQETNDDEKEIRASLRKGHLTFILHGKKLKGEFALIKNEHIGKNSWLLIKKGDEYARPKIDPSSKASLSIQKTNISNIKFEGAKKSAMPTTIKPMLATLVEDAFDSKDWSFEVKWDGYRAISFFDGKKAVIKSRNNIDFSERFFKISDAISKMNNKVVLDGEIVALDNDGQPHFEWLQNNKTNPQGHLVYYVFDILWCNGYDLQTWTLQKRRELLKRILPRTSHIKFSDDVKQTGKDFFAKAAKANLEGIMAKKLDSAYQQGVRGKDWLKIKTHMRQEVIVGGYTEPKGSREGIGALVVGVYKDNKLEYCGHVGGGFKDSELKDLRTRLVKIEVKKSPFTNDIKTNDVVHWVRPKLVGEVRFAEWTSDGRMRQPIFMGFRPDKPAKEVVRENAVKKAKAKVEAKKDSNNIELTHPDKVFWPEMGYTKGDLWNYYEGVSKYILPYLADRPESLLRQPDGYNGEKFFQKDISNIAPNWAKTISIHSDSAQKDIEYLICNDEKTLLYMVQLGCIEINPWNSRLKKIMHPDWIVIDLDPEGVSFETVIEVAQCVGHICNDLKIPAYPKTSGKTGIHIFIPLGAKYTYDQAKDFAFLLVNIVNKRLPKITSLERMPSKRPHKVYLDYLQNRGGQTLAAPYCVRPTKTANVSTPLHWREVKKGLRPEQFTIKTMPTRLKKVGDLFRPVLGKGVDINKILKQIELKFPQET